MWIGEPLLRREDPSLLAGSASFLADLAGPGTCVVGFVRSDVAHADIVSIESNAARTAAGVLAVFTATELDPPAQQSTHRLGTRPTPYYALAHERVRHVGEAVVAVVAESAAALADALGLVRIGYRELPAVVDARANGPVIFDGWPDNVAGTFECAMGDPAAAIADADVVINARFTIGRQTACSLEPRGVIADWDRHRRQLVVTTSTQSPHIVRDFVAEMTGLMTRQVTVRVPQVGGGFGAKFHHYVEETAVALIAMRLNRRVIWIEGRTESFLATVHAREQSIDAVLAASSDGRILAVTTDIVADMGSYLHMVSFGPAWLTSVMATGAYRVPNARSTVKAVVTNKTPSGSYRGWGQPQANFVIERLVDLLADRLELDPAEVRRRNLVPPEAMPYTSLFHTFDSGNYPEALERGLTLAGYEAVRRRQAEEPAGSTRLGIGLSFFVENTALGPSRQMNQGGLNQGGYDISKMRLEPDGSVTVYTGLCEMGQGFANGLAQLCAQTVGVRVDQVTVISGDTDLCPYTGHGTGASRSAAVGGAAIRKASMVLNERIRHIAAHMLEAAPDDLVIENGTIHVVGSPSRSITTTAVGRAAYLRAIDLPPDTDPGLEVVEVFDPTAMAWPYGLNVAVVEVDIETCAVRVVGFSVFHDCGTMLNPMIVEGQLHGGAAQGIAAALGEVLRFDAVGQPLITNLMGYLVPSAMEIPSFVLDHMVTESPVIPGGMKGIGEAGIIGAPAAVVNAIRDAVRFDLADRWLTPDTSAGPSLFNVLPLAPQALFELLNPVDVTLPL